VKGFCSRLPCQGSGESLSVFTVHRIGRRAHNTETMRPVADNKTMAGPLAEDDQRDRPGNRRQARVSLPGFIQKSAGRDRRKKTGRRHGQVEDGPASFGFAPDCPGRGLHVYSIGYCCLSGQRVKGLCGPKC